MLTRITCKNQENIWENITWWHSRKKTLSALIYSAKETGRKKSRRKGLYFRKPT